nr:Gaa1 domain containing protein [Haemonchus contortus]
MDAWLSEYHLVRHSALRADRLPEMGGVIIGGVAVKSHTGNSLPHLKLEVNHLNGQLPNLDLLNSMVRIAGSGKFAISPVIYDAPHQEQDGKDSHMLVPLRAMYTQAFVAVVGLHSVMGKYGVQAITVAVPPLNLFPVRKSTRLLEAIARALNNVLERFHQSYFLYILTSPDNFVSIAYFMPIIGGLLLPLAIFCCLATASVSLVNFSLAVCFALLAVPLMIKCTMDNDSKSRALVRTALVLACHPAGIMTVFLFYGRPILGFRKTPAAGPDFLISALLRLIKEHLVYGSNVLPLLLVLVLPMWNSMLSLALVKIKKVEAVEHDGTVELENKEVMS